MRKFLAVIVLALSLLVSVDIPETPSGDTVSIESKHCSGGPDCGWMED